VDDLDRAFDGLALVETRNGMMASAVNGVAADAALHLGRGACGGSDAHTLAAVARTYTVVPGAHTTEEFLAGLRAGRSVATGAHGGFRRLTSDAARVLAAGYLDGLLRGGAGRREAARLLGLLALLPVVPLLPAFTVAQWLRNRSFARRFHEAWRARRAVSQLPFMG
jgi:hypothetical protein